MLLSSTSQLKRGDLGIMKIAHLGEVLFFCEPF